MSIITPSQFLILKTIAQGTTAASDIAKATNMSLPYVLTQLTLLEAREEINEKILQKQAGPGKPKKHYTLSHNIATITILREGFGNKIRFEPSKMIATYLQILTLVEDKNKAAFSEYFWYNIKHFEKIHAIGFITEQNNTIEILALTDTKHLEGLRKQISNYTIAQKEYQDLRIACWVHSTEEILLGVKNHDDYYLNLVKRVKSLTDSKGELKKLLKEVKN